MSDEVKTFIDKLSTGNNTEAGEAFKDALRTKVGDALEVKRLVNITTIHICRLN